MLDDWVEREVKPRLRGWAYLIRYADDFVIGFTQEEDARRVLAVLPQRFSKYGLTIHPDKTRLIPFQQPPPAGKEQPFNCADVLHGLGDQSAHGGQRGGDRPGWRCCKSAQVFRGSVSAQVIYCTVKIRKPIPV